MRQYIYGRFILAAELPQDITMQSKHMQDAVRLYSEIESPVGPLLLLGDGAALCAMYMRNQKYRPPANVDWRRDDASFRAAREQLDAYFAGELRAFDLSLRMEGTEFQRRVWNALRDIPYGATESYGQIAARIGSPGAARAVGLANGRNPIGIIVPCHRVIGASGALTGYGGGLHRKRWLLAHEQRDTLSLFG
jgi:methylated-DNA-[protein]-cysteine S-methyltransferase